MRKTCWSWCTTWYVEQATVGGVGNCFFFSLTIVGGVVFVVGFIWCVVDLVLSVLLISSFPPGLGSKGIGPRTKKMYTHCGPA
jgi:hypothetical protein